MGSWGQRGSRSQTLRGQEERHRRRGLMRGNRVRFVFLKDHSGLAGKTCWEGSGRGGGDNRGAGEKADLNLSLDIIGQERTWTWKSDPAGSIRAQF